MKNSKKLKNTVYEPADYPDRTAETEDETAELKKKFRFNTRHRLDHFCKRGLHGTVPYNYRTDRRSLYPFPSE